MAERKMLENQISALEKSENADSDEIAELHTKLCDMDVNSFRRIVVDDITPELKQRFELVLSKFAEQVLMDIDYNNLESITVTDNFFPKS